MTPDVVAVLVLPAAGDPGGLLAHGAMGDIPAWAWRGPHATEWQEPDLNYEHHRHGAALPLWWDGALVPEGWDRARRAMYRIRADLDEQSEPWCLLDPALPDVVWAAGRMAAGARLASRVVRLARVDGRLVEVEP